MNYYEGHILATITLLSTEDEPPVALAPYNGGTKGRFLALKSYVERRLDDYPEYDHGEVEFSDGRPRLFFYIYLDGFVQWEEES